MKTTITVVRILLGLIFTVFGLNGFLHFIPMQPLPQPAIDFFGALAATGYMIRLIFFGQLIGGVLLLTGVAVPLALVILAPIVVNILFFHLFLAPGGLAIAFVLVRGARVRVLKTP
jgi:putative oxidoreductase